jgi:hypothetical protein
MNRDTYKKSIKNYLNWNKKLGQFPFSPSPLKPLLTYVGNHLDGDPIVRVYEGENKAGQVKFKDLEGRGVDVSKDGRIWIGHRKKGKQDGLVRFISLDGNL